MKSLIKTIRQHAWQQPKAIAIQGEHTSLSYLTLLKEVESLSSVLSVLGVRSLAIVMDNSPAWAIVDLAAMAADITVIPIPQFFTSQQVQHALVDGGVDAIITDCSQQLSKLVPDVRTRPLARIAGMSCWLAQIPNGGDRDLNGIAKITYTSGTTGSPKGVCLTQEAMFNVTSSLCEALEVNNKDRHLTLLPFAVLLENVGGIYAPLLAGATCVINSLETVGLAGSSGLDVQRMYQSIAYTSATSIILLPQMLQALVAVIQSGMPVPDSLRFIAVGGAPVSQQLLAQAQHYQLPVYEGYGLSECSSVVAVNTPAEHKQGSVGKLLPHIQIRFADDGEILLKGNLFSGYLNHEHFDNEWYASGDLGYMDEEGYLYLTGRKKNCFITSFGRNVAPEWVERELTLSPAIAQAAVFGEAKPFNVAVITPRNAAPAHDIQQAINDANQLLPDYAQITAWIESKEPFSMHNQQLTPNGRLRRDAIWQGYASRIDNLYDIQTTG